MVVDDEPNTVVALRLLLEDDGHEVDAFTSGDEAVRALEEGHFDVVLADLEMPKVPGNAVVRSARRHHPAACIFATTARSRHQRPQEACHIFDKPLDYARVVRTVARCRAHRGPGRRGLCYMKTNERD